MESMQSIIFFLQIIKNLGSHENYINKSVELMLRWKSVDSVVVRIKRRDRDEYRPKNREMVEDILHGLFWTYEEGYH